MKTLATMKQDLLKDASTKKIYDELGSEFAIIERLIAQRLKKGVSQAELARRIGSKQSSVSRFESGSYNPTIQFLYKVADALDAKIQFTVS